MSEGGLSNSIVEIYSPAKINGYDAGQYHVIGEIFFPGKRVGVSQTYELGIESTDGPLLILLRRSHGGQSREDKGRFSRVENSEVIATIEACLTDNNRQEIEQARLGILERITQPQQ